jgi:hypothetical protein
MQIDASGEDFVTVANELDALGHVYAATGMAPERDIRTMSQAVIKLRRAAALISAFAHNYETMRADRDAWRKRAEAAEADLNVLRKKSGWKCYACYYDSHYSRDVCAGCGYNNDNNWRWRGPDGGGEDKL